VRRMVMSCGLGRSRDSVGVNVVSAAVAIVCAVLIGIRCA